MVRLLRSCALISDNKVTHRREEKKKKEHPSSSPSHLLRSPVQPFLFVSAQLQAGEQVTDGGQRQTLLSLTPLLQQPFVLLGFWAGLTS